MLRLGRLVNPYFIFMYMHNNHYHRATVHLQLNILLLLQIFADVSNEPIATSSASSSPRRLDYLTLKVNILLTFETLVTIYQPTRRNIPEDLNPILDIYQN